MPGIDTKPQRGRYASIEFNPSTSRALFKARCGACGCKDDVVVGPCGTAGEVPGLLRSHGWRLTGITGGAIWWCGKHAPKGAR